MDDKLPDAPGGSQSAADDRLAAEFFGDDGAAEIRRTKAGDLIVWAPAIRSSIRPLVTLGRFRNGTPAIHFRRYRVRPDGVAVMTDEGASFRIDEVVELVERLRATFDAIPSLRGEPR